MTQIDGGGSASPESKTKAIPPGSGAHHGWRSMGGILAVQTQNAFNDHLVKMFIIFLARAVSGDLFGKNIAEILTLIILLSFILFSPIAGFLADRYSKRSVIKVCLLAQVGIFAIIAAGIHFHSLAIVTGGFILLAIQSVFFSPGKFGIPKELVGSKGVGLAASLLQMLTMLAILAGMWVSGPWFDSLSGPGVSAWDATLIPILVVGGLSLIPLLLLLIVRPVPAAHPGKPFRTSILYSQLHDLGALLKPRNLRLAGMGVAFFWGLSSFIGVAVVDIGYATNPSSAAGAGAATETSLLSVSLGLGVLFGSLFTSFVSRRGIELGIVPIGGIGIFIGLLWTGLATPTSAGIYFALGFIGMAGAMFMIPLNAYLQEHANPKSRGQIMAAANLFDCLAGALFVGIYIGVKSLRGDPTTPFDPQPLILILAGPALLIALYVFRILPQNFLRFIILTVIRRLYHIQPFHHDRIPEKGGVLLVANHLTYIDAFAISAACDRPVRFLIFDHYYKIWWMRPFLKLLGAVPISATKAKAAVRSAADAIRKGEVLCIFPEGQLSRTGMPNEIKNGFALIARSAGSPVVPVFMDTLWGSIFSFESGKYFKKRPLKIPYSIRITFGHPMEPKSANGEILRSTFQTLGEEAFRAREEIHDGLPRAVTRALAKSGRRPAVIDARIHSRNTKRRPLLSIARRLAHAWKDDFKDEPRVGVLLTNSGAATMIHTGLILAGKIPVNLPLDPGENPEALRDAIESAGIKTVITAKAFRDSVKNYPWPESVREVGPEIKRAADGLFLESLKLTLLPTALLLPKRIADPDSEAVAWISRQEGGLPWRGALRNPRSESAETPKESISNPPATQAAPHPEGGFSNPPATQAASQTPGCPPEENRPFTFQSLSHAALVANAHQLTNANLFHRSDRILTCTDAATFAGVVNGLWHPILHGIPAVNLPLAAKPETVGLFAESAGATVGVADSLPRAQACASKLRATYLIAPLGTINSIATQDLADQGIYPLGTLTEPPSHVTASIPHPDANTQTAAHQDGWIENSPGRPLPGLALRQSESGDLEVKGAALGTEDWVPLPPGLTQNPGGFLVGSE